ncbi:hypothetical protein IFM89_002330 [Coptis chinensis]|uniref:Uncharacterized protein n=1 Tax=Coptis chinensis TaxID=261450 RepID=A0A835IGQ5_9MAGN|nr:hypothetical protein IFM89_002330 [Coptis chinensis]
MLERAAGKALVDLVACQPSESNERRESMTRWVNRLRITRFSSVAYSDDMADDVCALLRRYKEGWSMISCSDIGIFLVRKDQPVDLAKCSGQSGTIGRMLGDRAEVPENAYRIVVDEILEFHAELFGVRGKTFGDIDVGSTVIWPKTFTNVN